MSTIPLPRGYEFGSEVEIKKPNTDTILQVYDKTESGKIYTAMLALLEGSVASIDGVKPTLAQLKKMPIVSAEVVIVEAFKKYDVPTLVEGVYPCPRCGNKIIHEETKSEDTRDNILDLKIKYDRFDDLMKATSENYNYKEAYFKLELSDSEKLQFGDDTFVHGITFRDPTVEDMIDIQNDATLQTPSSQQKKLYFKCIAGIDFLHPSIEDWQVIKNRFMYELVRFDDYRTFDKVSVGLRQYGYYPFIELGCGNCRKVWEAAIDFTGFFVYALRSNLGSQGKKG